MIIKWAGGKSRLAARIVEALGPDRGGVYREPFAGALHVFRALGCGAAEVGDANARLVAMWRAVRDDPCAVSAALGSLGVDGWRERYYGIRQAYNEGPWEGPDHAARFVWLNRASFNGLYRENRRGHFNVPVGRYATLRLPTSEAIADAAAVLRRAVLRHEGFAAALERAQAGDRVYCDPPYWGTHAAYCAAGFGPADHADLSVAARCAAARGAVVVISNSDCAPVRDLYADARRLEIVTDRRSISRSASSRGAAAELLITL